MYVWRLVIEYPEGSQEPGWTPTCWERLPARARRKVTRRGFRWPRERLYLSASGAYQRAWLLRWYGAEVEVRRSAPVDWPEPRPGRWERNGGAMSCWDPADDGERPVYDLSGLPYERAAR